jgi:hypothetical protein
MGKLADEEFKELLQELLIEYLTKVTIMETDCQSLNRINPSAQPRHLPTVPPQLQRH